MNKCTKDIPFASYKTCIAQDLNFSLANTSFCLSSAITSLEQEAQAQVPHISLCPLYSSFSTAFVTLQQAQISFNWLTDPQNSGQG